jgi:hypothetical protein
LSHGTCSYIRMYINAVADSGMFYLQYDFCNINFKIKHKLCVASRSGPPFSREEFWVRTWYPALIFTITWCYRPIGVFPYIYIYIYTHIYTYIYMSLQTVCASLSPVTAALQCVSSCLYRFPCCLAKVLVKRILPIVTGSVRRGYLYVKWWQNLSDLNENLSSRPSCSKTWRHKLSGESVKRLSNCHTSADRVTVTGAWRC